jgi:hypothetical protein
MKKKIWLWVMGLCLISSVAAAATVKVITQEAMIRKDKRFFAPALVRAPFGAALQESGREGDWFRVSYQGKEGWIHKSAVQEQKFQLSSLAGGQAEEASQDEVALAGKGFNPQVESQYKKDNSQLAAAYAQVDRVEAMTVPQPTLNQFIASGKLNK